MFQQLAHFCFCPLCQWKSGDRPRQSPQQPSLTTLLKHHHKDYSKFPEVTLTAVLWFVDISVRFGFYLTTCHKLLWLILRRRLFSFPLTQTPIYMCNINRKGNFLHCVVTAVLCNSLTWLPVAGELETSIVFSRSKT